MSLEPSNGTRFAFSSEAQVSRVSLDMSVRLLIEELGSGFTEVVVNTPFELALGSEAGVVIDPEHLTGRCLSAIHGVLWAGVERVELWPDGELRVIAPAFTLRVPAHESYEAWELIRPDGLIAVGLPGGDYSLFRS